MYGLNTPSWGWFSSDIGSMKNCNRTVLHAWKYRILCFHHSTGGKAGQAKIKEGQTIGKLSESGFTGLEDFQDSRLWGNRGRGGWGRIAPGSSAKNLMYLFWTFLNTEVNFISHLPTVLLRLKTIRISA